MKTKHALGTQVLILDPSDFHKARNSEYSNLATLPPESIPEPILAPETLNFAVFRRPNAPNPPKFSPAAPELPNSQRLALCRQDLPLGGLVNDASWTDRLWTLSLTDLVNSGGIDGRAAPLNGIFVCFPCFPYEFER